MTDSNVIRFPTAPTPTRIDLRITIKPSSISLPVETGALMAYRNAILSALKSAGFTGGDTGMGQDGADIWLTPPDSIQPLWRDGDPLPDSPLFTLD